MANEFKNFRANVVGATDTVIVPESGGTVNSRTRSAASTAIVFAVYIANVDTVNDVTVDIDTYDGTTAYPLGKSLPVPAGSTLYFNKPIVLETTERLRVRTALSSDITVTAPTLVITA